MTDAKARKPGLPPFKPQRWAEKLLRLRKLNPQGFLQKTSESTRRALEYYEVWKQQDGGKERR